MTTTTTKTPQICIFDNEKQYFCTLCTCIFYLLTMKNSIFARFARAFFIFWQWKTSIFARFARAFFIFWQWKTAFLHALHVHFLSFDNEKQHFCTLCTCIFLLLTFWRRSRSFYDVKWPVLQMCGQREHMMTNVQFCFLVSQALVPIFELKFQVVRTHFSSIMTLNNWKMIAETRSYFFRWRSRFRRRSVCLSPIYTSNFYMALFMWQFSFARVDDEKWPCLLYTSDAADE